MAHTAGDIGKPRDPEVVLREIKTIGERVSPEVAAVLEDFWNLIRMIVTDMETLEQNQDKVSLVSRVHLEITKDLALRFSRMEAEDAEAEDA